MADDPNNPNPPAPPADPPAPPKSWDDVLAALPDDAKAAHEAHIAGLKSALDKERSAATAADAERKRLEAEKAASAEAALAAQGEFKTLAEQRAEALKAAETEAATLKADLEAKSAMADKYAALVQKQLDEQKAALKLPPAITELMSRMTTEEQIDWLTKNGKEFAANGGSLPPSPRGDGTGKLTEAEKAGRVARTW